MVQTYCHQCFFLFFFLKLQTGNNDTVENAMDDAMCERNKWLKTQFLKVPRQGHANAKVLPMSQGIRSSGPENANLKKEEKC